MPLPGFPHPVFRASSEKSVIHRPAPGVHIVATIDGQDLTGESTPHEGAHSCPNRFPCQKQESMKRKNDRHAVKWGAFPALSGHAHHVTGCYFKPGAGGHPTRGCYHPIAPRAGPLAPPQSPPLSSVTSRTPNAWRAPSRSTRATANAGRHTTGRDSQSGRRIVPTSGQWACRGWGDSESHPFTAHPRG